jgi:hypothetical protein
MSEKQATEANHEVIDVTCLVFPDGSTFWFPIGDCVPGKAVEAWKAALPAEKRRLYHDMACLGRRRESADVARGLHAQHSGYDPERSAVRCCCHPHLTATHISNASPTPGSR